MSGLTISTDNKEFAPIKNPYKVQASVESTETTPIETPVEAAPAAVAPVEVVAAPVAAVVEPTSVVEPEKPDYEGYFNTKFKELTGFESPAEIAALKTQLEGTIKPTNETIAKLNDFCAKGGTPEEFYNNFLATNLDAMQPFEVLKAEYKKENPHLSIDKVEAILRDDYGMDEDGTFESVAKQAKFESAVHKAKESLNQYRQDNSIPASQRRAEIENQEFQKKQEAWNATVDNTTSNYSTLKVPLGENQAHEWNVTADTQKKVNEVMKNPTKIWEYFSNAEQLRNALTMAIDGEKLASVIASQQKEKAVETVIEEKLINSSATPRPANVTEPVYQTPAEALRAIQRARGMNARV